MSYISDLAAGFMGLFQTGAQTFIGWMTSIVPVVLLLLVLMNTIIAFIGEERIERFAQRASRNVFMRYLILPFLAAFMLGNPMCFTLARFLPEYYKPSYYAAQAQFCHTSNGVFPHINPGELFVWLGIAQGVQQLGLNEMDLAIRYMLVGIVLNFIGGWVTDFTTSIVCRQTGVMLSKTVDISARIGQAE
ncbi:PTS system, glucitol/sorbitol-specific, IIC subunit [Coriobacterium glomerans PW2]|uniref:PTS system, glucitol/sorbitol-specific, IIC subunit n=1 Tax=Coriobacterium glomerans (strain ATCC 49209 / DSM 20642 / JCM 10262 / PW2) TaxID=700015 RepID=F2NAV3_CORGP|nr:PTS glucitol/sorbitol transporter subunit IIC [Coriobacterium glomerans]AEB07631.1 PTS system, glucitol/sorbitol-specific, IIC subunit [Coriobacterium glomerans PW2]